MPNVRPTKGWNWVYFLDLDGPYLHTKFGAHLIILNRQQPTRFCKLGYQSSVAVHLDGLIKKMGINVIQETSY